MWACACMCRGMPTASFSTAGCCILGVRPKHQYRHHLAQMFVPQRSLYSSRVVPFRRHPKPCLDTDSRSTTITTLHSPPVLAETLMQFHSKPCWDTVAAQPPPPPTSSRSEPRSRSKPVARNGSCSNCSGCVQNVRCKCLSGVLNSNTLIGFVVQHHRSPRRLLRPRRSDRRCRWPVRHRRRIRLRRPYRSGRRRRWSVHRRSLGSYPGPLPHRYSRNGSSRRYRWRWYSRRRDSRGD